MLRKINREKDQREKEKPIFQSPIVELSRLNYHSHHLKQIIIFRAKGWIMYGIDSKLKLGKQLKNFRTI